MPVESIDPFDNWHNAPANTFLAITTTDGETQNLLKWTNTKTQIIGVPFISPMKDQDRFDELKDTDAILIRINKDNIIYIKLVTYGGEL